LLSCVPKVNGCPKEATMHTGHIITKTEADNQTQVKLSPRDLLHVVLPSNASTGYSWSVVVDPDFPLRLIRHGYLSSGPGPVGAPGREEFLFSTPRNTIPQGSRAGGWLRFLYLRPFEQEINISTRSTELWQINVTVESPGA
jgi:predicted secreted protein